MLLRTILLLTALSGLAYGHILGPAGCDPSVFYTDDTPEFICGTDLKIYPNRREFNIARCLNNIDLLEIPLFMCYPQSQGDLQNEVASEIGLRMFNIPERPQQKVWNQNINQRNIHQPITNRLRENLYGNRRLPGQYYGHNLRGALKDKIYPSKYDRYGTRAPISSQVYQNNGLARTARQYPDTRFRNPLRANPLSIRTPQYPQSVPYDPYFMRSHFQPRFPPYSLNPVPYPVNMPFADQFGNVPTGATKSCDEELTSEDSVPELKTKTGRKVPDASKPTKPKGGKPNQKAKVQKTTKKPNKETPSKTENEDNKKVEEGGPEALRQAVEERSSLKVLQSLSKNSTKKADSADKKPGNAKSDDENKPDKNEQGKGKDEKPDDSPDKKSRKEGDQSLEQDAATDAKPDKSRAETTDEKENDGSSIER